ncbi:site-2 protease family protein [Demequina sp. TTPB684]|uniref:site-2 protease family protein n=1 Tax=unclassified Demequina TaxID=2620311 RepID=UPI001CF18CA8|nr:MULTISPECIES: site-2 protease family protein [unclassified Demequina]MCB2413921.1 site-2 protease family protein [Demequina sp. TTPB684]UPU89391.1 site-2 protease family protein [Demequina sp. TMPB413]
MEERRTRGILVGRILGAQVIVQPSTLLMLALLAYVFASASGETTARTLSVGAMLAVALMGSVLLHEIAHAIAARLFGRSVNEIVLTLWGGHTSFESSEMTPTVNGVTAAAGPAMNLVIAGVAGATMAATELGGVAGSLVSYIVWANLLLAVFNLLPGIPMDGGRVLESVVWAITRNRHRGTVVAAWGGRVVAVGVVVYSIAGPLLSGERPSLTSVVIAVLIFSILWPAASAALAFSATMLRRDGVNAKSLMRDAVAVPYTVSVQEALDAASAAGAVEVVVLGADDAPAARFPLEQAEAVPAPARATASLESVTTPVPRGAEIPAGAAAEVMIPALREWWGKTDVWVVRDGQDVVGIVRLVDVLAALK